MPKFSLGIVIKYTIYIDESGDFESSKGQWVLAGILLADSYQNCENVLNTRFKSVPEELGLKTKGDFHLTEFRTRFGHQKAVSMARHVFRQLEKLPIEFHAVAAINFSKSSLSAREKTYRLMLFDILALCETVIPDSQIISKLDLVVASRTIEGIRQTTVSDINHDVLKKLPFALEVDLATKGLVDLMGKNLNVHMDYANNSWGLVCADFLANLNYHNGKPEEQQVLEDLARAGKYSLFESFGSFDIRRARVAERSRDYALALYRWVAISEESEKRNMAKEATQRLLHKLFNKQGTTGHSVAFEELIERLWRPSNSPEKYMALLRELEFFETELSLYFSNNPASDFEYWLFRLRNLMLIVTNHLGSTTTAYAIIEKQKSVLSILATNPEHFSRVLDFKIAEAEASINALDFEKAMTLALEYSQIIENYRGVWQLLVDEEDLCGFEGSKIHIKSEMSLFRISILCLGLSKGSNASGIQNRFLSLESLITNRLDLSRFNNYKVMFLLKQHKAKDAIDHFVNILLDEQDTVLGSYDLFWFLKSVNDDLLSLNDIENIHLIRLIEKQVASFDLNATGHPNDLVIRELALYEFQQGNTSRARKLIVKSIKAMELGDSEISNFLREVNRYYEDYIVGRVRGEEDYFQKLTNNSLVQKINELNSNLSFMKKIRHFAPY